MRISRAPSGHRCGSSHPKARLTDEQVKAMRADSQEIGYEKLAKRYGRGISTARDIVTYRTRINA